MKARARRGLRVGVFAMAGMAAVLRSGGPLGDTVHACASCEAVAGHGATWRQQGSSLARENARRWQ
jgi:hypothetical protein